MVQNLQCLKTPQICFLRHAEHHAKNRTSLRGQDHCTLFFEQPLTKTLLVVGLLENDCLLSPFLRLSLIIHLPFFPFFSFNPHLVRLPLIRSISGRVLVSLKEVESVGPSVRPSVTYGLNKIASWIMKLCYLNEDSRDRYSSR